MQLKIYKNPPSHDSDDVRFLLDTGKEVGFGYKARDEDRIGLIRCPKCEAENYAMSVASGQCAWCGFNANDL